MSKNAPINRDEPPHKGGVQTSARLVPVLVFVLWTSCLLVGVLGFAMPYARPKVICFCDPVIEVQKIEVELKEDQTPPLPVPVDASLPPPPLDALTPPPVPQPSSPVALASPSAPAVIAVAPSPSIAFALPVVNPQQLTKVASAASYRAPTAQPAAPALPAPQALTFGYGDGRQPEPTYPSQALREGQEGVVTVRLLVGADGRVTSAEASQPSPWPLLNDSAVRTILRKWRFPAGGLRLYEVAIRFQLRDKASSSSQP